MAAKKVYREIEPGKKRFKTFVTRAFFFFVGMGMQAAYRIEPEAKKEVDSWPETFTFRMAVVNGPSMCIMKKAKSLTYLFEKEVFSADVEMWFKSIDYAYFTMTGRISVPDAVYHNRQYIKGDLGYMLSIMRVINLTQTLLLPNLISRFYIKEVPRLTLRKIWNRIVTYVHIGTGILK